MEADAFIRWWRASKYMQVVFSSDALRQAARDGWDAALAAQSAEIEAMKADAERWRWLRDKCNHVAVGVHIQFSSNERNADNAIDAARQAAGGSRD